MDTIFFKKTKGNSKGKNYSNEMKILLGWLRRIEMTKERISECKAISIKIIQSK